MPDDSGSSVPISPPDPTPLTTANLLREVAHVRIEIAAVEANIRTRLDGMDKAVALFHEDLVGVPTDTDKQICNLKEKVNVQFDGVKEQLVSLKESIGQTFKTFEEKFNGVKDRFGLNDLALNAALAAAKELVNRQTEASNIATTKSETANTKLMDQMRDIVNTNNAGLNDKIDDGRNRMTALEGRLVGLLQDVAQIRAVAPPIPPVANGQPTSIGIWVAAGFGLLLLIAILIFEIMGRVPVGLVK